MDESSVSDAPGSQADVDLVGSGVSIQDLAVHELIGSA